MTVEGLADGDAMHPLQAAFWEHHGQQCGFCTPGMLMTARELLERNPQPDEAGDPRRAVGQPLPLHGLPAHRRRDPGRGEEAAMAR